MTAAAAWERDGANCLRRIPDGGVASEEAVRDVYTLGYAAGEAEARRVLDQLIDAIRRARVADVLSETVFAWFNGIETAEPLDARRLYDALLAATQLLSEDPIR